MPMSNKSPAMKALIEAFFPGTAERIRKSQCPCCGEHIGQFRDELSKEEYQISGMCQKCQDVAFDEGAYSQG